MPEITLSTSLQTLEAEAMKLPPDERAEIEQRLRDHDEGRVLSAPLDEVLARVRAKYGA